MAGGNEPFSIAIDAMGGDHAPASVVEGALAYVQGQGRGSLLLVGDQPEVERELARLSAPRDAFQIVHAPDTVGMGEAAATAVRRKPNSSIAVCARLAKDGEAAAIVSAGNTGAAVAACQLRLRPLKAVDRPAIATWVPTRSGGCVLLDVGANSDCKPTHMVQFAVMGAVYAEHILGRKEPRVGLLNIGEESSKGNELAQASYPLLAQQSGFNFVGNVEGRDIYNGRCDVVVTDGFTGNVALKISESLAEMIGAMIKEELLRDARSKLGAKLAMPAFERFRKRIDYTEMGGAPLLGIDGAAIICHGASPVKAIKNAVRVAQEWANAGLNDHIKAALEAEVQRGGREGGRE